MPGHIVSLNVATARPLEIQGRKVLSAIGKRAVDGPCAVHSLGLEGDEQADLSVHGGLAKAVYAYPVEHYRFWRFPCVKFDAAMGFRQASSLMNANAWCGFYLAVRVAGTLRAGDAFELIEGPREVGITELFRARAARSR